MTGTRKRWCEEKVRENEDGGRGDERKVKIRN